MSQMAGVELNGSLNEMIIVHFVPMLILEVALATKC
jgi:hypothetical protein